MSIWPFQRQIIKMTPILTPTLHYSFQGAGHNDVELYNQYLERLRHFVAQEITN